MSTEVEEVKLLRDSVGRALGTRCPCDTETKRVESRVDVLGFVRGDNQCFEVSVVRSDSGNRKVGMTVSANPVVAECGSEPTEEALQRYQGDVEDFACRLEEIAAWVRENAPLPKKTDEKGKE